MLSKVEIRVLGLFNFRNMSLEAILIQAFAGAFGGNMVGTMVEELSFGPALNCVIGAIGGFIFAYGMNSYGFDFVGIDSVGIVMGVFCGIVGATLLMLIVAFLNKIF